MALRPSSSFGMLRRSDSRNMYTLAASGPSRASLSSLALVNPELHAMRMERMRELNAQADLLASKIYETSMHSASQESLLRKRRPASAAQLPQLINERPKIEKGPPAFINAPRKMGAKTGYIYKIGPKGAGYYRDPNFSQKQLMAQMKADAKEAAAVEEEKAAVKAAKEAAKPQLTHEQKFQQEKELKGLMALAEEGLNSRFSDMYKAFQYLDLDRSGRLNHSEIRRGLDMWNIPINDRQLELIMGDCDQDDDGGVSYEEFVDKLARGTVSNAAMGKRGMQSLEAMGVDSQEMLAEQLGHKKLAKFKPTVN